MGQPGTLVRPLLLNETAKTTKNVAGRHGRRTIYLHHLERNSADVALTVGLSDGRTTNQRAVDAWSHHLG